MSEIEELFKNAIDSTRNKKKIFHLIIGTVTAIDGETCTVDAYEDVRLNAVIDSLSSQFTIYPKIASKVIIGTIENQSDHFVVKVSEIEKVTIKIGDQVFEMKNGKFKIEAGGVSLKSILNDGFNQIKNAVITTPSGPGSLSPADVLAFDDLNLKVNKLLQ